MQNYSFSNIYARLDKSFDIMQTYCKLVEHCYRNVLGLKSYQLNPYDIIFDNSASPVIIMSKKEIIGGAILYTRSLNELAQLPLERSADINIKNVIHANGLNTNSYICEISKIAVQDKYRDRRITQEILGLILAKAVKEGCDYMFAITPKNKSRNFRVVYNKLGISYHILDQKIENVPLYENLKIDLTYANFKTFNLTKLLSKCYFKELISQMYNLSGTNKINFSLNNSQTLRLGAKK